MAILSESPISDNTEDKCTHQMIQKVNQHLKRMKNTTKKIAGVNSKLRPSK